MVKTKQRQLILDTLHTMNCHPTADTLFLEIRKELPTISLATVYRNLNTMAAGGTIRKISMPDAPDRFDWNCTVHDHMICDHCGQIWDFTLPHTLNAAIEQQVGVPITTYQLIAHGTCKTCPAASNV